MAIDPKDVAKGFVLFAGVMFFLYFFLVGLALLGDAFKVIAGDSAGSLFGSVTNPIAGLMVGILATVLVQSSSTTTSIIVAAAGSGALEVNTGIYMIMGANIGTSVTNTIVSLGFVQDQEQYRRGFAGATVHDMFNYMNVCLWLPLEAISSAINGGDGGILYLLSKALTDVFTLRDDESWEGPLKKITAKISKKVISVDKDVIKDFALGSPSLEVCEDVLCVGDNLKDGECKNYKFSSKRCGKSPLGVNQTRCGDLDDEGEEISSSTKAEFAYCIYNGGDIQVEEDIMAAAKEHFDAYKLNKAGVFAENGVDDKAGGYITLVLSLVILIISLLGMVKLLGIAVRGAAEEFLKKALNMNGYLAILVGAGVTIFVQSSSITTSTLTPLVAIGTLTLEGMLPLTLGANIGTTVTGILAALVSGSQDGLQVAIVHVLFNVFGVILFYPIPKVRAVPIKAARHLGDLAATFKAFPIFYIFMLFLVYPGIILGISVGIETGGGALAGAIIGLLFFIVGHVGFFFWYHKKEGKAWLVNAFGRDFPEEREGEGKVVPSA